MKEIIRIRKYKKGDEKQIIPLINQCFNQNIDLNYWKWKYEKNPYGHEILVAINKKGEIVGHHGNRYKKGQYKNKVSLFFDTVDVCVNPKYKGNHFLSQAFDFLPKIKFISYGFPNIKSRKSYKSNNLPYGRINIPKYNIYIKLLRLLISILKVKSNITYNEVSLESETKNKKIFNALWDEKKIEVNTAIIRDWNFIKWRFLDNPKPFRICLIMDGQKCIGYACFIQQGKTALIYDFIILNKYLSLDLLLGAFNYFLNSGFSNISLYVYDKVINKKMQIIFFKSYMPMFFFNNIDKNKYLDFYITLADTDLDKC